MKTKITCVTFALLSFLFLCSFTYKNSENENIYLQKEDKTTDYIQNLSESRSKSSDTGEDELREIYDSFISALPDGVPKSSDEILGAAGVNEVFSWLSSFVTSKENVRSLLLFVFIGIILALSEFFLSEHGGEGSTASAVTGIILSVPLIVMIEELVVEVVDAICQCSELFSGMIPALTALLALGSGGAAASVSGVGLSVSLGFVSGVLAECLLPLSAMIFSISVISSLDTGGVTDGTAKGIRSIFNYLIGFSSLIIAGVLGIQTVIAVSADNLALKSAKYTLCGMIPIVGSTVSGALSTLIAGVKLLSVNVGAVSVVAMLSLVCRPLVRLLFFRFSLSLSMNVASLSGGGFGARLFSSLRGALDTVTAVFASSVLIYLLEIIIITSSIRGAL